MENTNNILDELKEIAPAVANLDKHHIYYIPDGYFDFLAQDIVARIKIDQFFSVTNPYEIPKGFFEGLPDIIMQKIRATQRTDNNTEVYSELHEIAPLLSKVNKENVFSVPDGYFETIKVPYSVEKPVVKMISRGSPIRQWVNYAVAASVLFVIATASFLYSTLHPHDMQNSITIEQRLAGLRDDDMVKYLKDNQEILSGDLTPDMQDPEIQSMLQNTSDAEIQSYLNDYEADEKYIKGI